MGYLLVALAALGVGPLAFHRLRGRPAWSAALDGFVLVSIGGLVVLHFLAPAVERLDVLVIACLVTGFLGPVLLGMVTQKVRAELDPWWFFLGFTGLAVHAALDGAALASAALTGTGTMLALAVILHRLPVGIAIWWLATKVAGRRTGLIALLALMGATVFGFQLGSNVTHAHGGPGLVTYYQAFVAGMLLHVAVHPAHGRPRMERAWPAGFGALGGLLLLIAVALLPVTGAKNPDPYCCGCRSADHRSIGLSPTRGAQVGP